MSQDDADLWQKVKATIRPLHGHKAGAAPQRASSYRAVSRSAPFYIPTPEPKAPVHPQKLKALRLDKTVDIDTNTERRLRQGQMEIDGRLDLHGQTVEQAHRSLIRFVQQSYTQGRRCVLVITGRSGQLRQEVPRWLNEADIRPFIISLAPAQVAHGGHGALYVLLKRQRGI